MLSCNRYDSKRRFKPQVNLLYVYSLSSDVSAPVYYKQFLGSTPDVSAFADILNECGISSKKYTVIADKGFAAEEQFEALTEKELSYVIPIKRGSKLVAACLPLTPQSFSDLFTYNGRAIQSFKIEEDGFNVFVYYDAQLSANELADAAERAEQKNEKKRERCRFGQIVWTSTVIRFTEPTSNARQSSSFSERTVPGWILTLLT